MGNVIPKRVASLVKVTLELIKMIPMPDQDGKGKGALRQHQEVGSPSSEWIHHQNEPVLLLMTWHTVKEKKEKKKSKFK